MAGRLRWQAMQNFTHYHALYLNISRSFEAQILEDEITDVFEIVPDSPASKMLAQLQELRRYLDRLSVDIRRLRSIVEYHALGSKLEFLSLASTIPPTTNAFEEGPQRQST